MNGPPRVQVRCGDGRLWIGVDTDPTYVALARRRVATEAAATLF